MGNLRQKYTDEGWEEIQNPSESYKSKKNFTEDEVFQLLKEQRQLCASSIYNVLNEDIREALKTMIINSPEPKNWKR